MKNSWGDSWGENSLDSFKPDHMTKNNLIFCHTANAVNKGMQVRAART